MKTPKIFQNNGHLRGLIYTGIPVLAAIGSACSVWTDTPPKNIYAVGVVVCAAVVAGLTALRGYLDQHLSRAEEEPIVEPASDTVIVDNPNTVHK